MNQRTQHRIFIIATLLLAFALRIAAIDQVPVGLSHDEAANGIAALQVLDGYTPIFFEINKGIEPLIIYLEALAFQLFGIGPVQLRLVNVIFGLLTVALVYPLTHRLFDRRVALWAMIGLALSFWAIFVSRLTLRAVLLPPLLTLTLYLLWRGFQTNVKAEDVLRPARLILPDRWLYFFVLSGIMAGVSMYSYLSSRFIPFLIIALFAYHLSRRQLQAKHWLGVFICGGVLTLLFIPLGSYYLENIESFSRRSNQVTTIPYALNGEFGPMARNTLKTLGMFTFFGDETDRYNLDGRPVFDWLNGLVFYIGLGFAGVALLRSTRLANSMAWLFIWSFFMLLPDFITDDSPHFLRTIGALPPVYIFWAIGLHQLQNWLRLKDWSLVAVYVPVGLVLLMTGHSSYDYFFRWRMAPEARHIYGADIAAIAQSLITTPQDDYDFAAISAEYFRDHDPARLQLHFSDQPPFVIWFDGQQSLAFPPPQSGLRPAYFFAASAPAITMWQPFLQEISQDTTPAYTLFQAVDSATLQQAWDDTFPPQNRPMVTVNDDLIITGYKILGEVRRGGKFQTLLGWQALRTLPPDADYTFLLKLQGSEGQTWAETDGNGYTPGNWQPGVLGLQLLTLRLPEDLSPQDYQLSLEIVDRLQQQALPTADGRTIIVLQTVTP